VQAGRSKQERQFGREELAGLMGAIPAFRSTCEKQGGPELKAKWS
jgi:hypothetical protein